MSLSNSSTRTKSSNSTVLTIFLPEFRDLNFGIILISFYFAFEFGALQGGIMPIINQLHLPFILIVILICYSIYLILAGQVDFKSPTTKMFVFLVVYKIAYILISTKDPFAKEDMIKVFIGFLAHYLVITVSIKKPAQLLLLIDIWLVSVTHSSFHGILQGGLIWGNRWLKDENHISLLAAIAIPFVFLLLFAYRNKIRKTCYMISMGFIVAVNVVAASRGGVLGLILAGFFCWLLSKYKLRILMLLIIFVILVFRFAPPHLFTEMKTLNQGTQEATADDRLYLWGIGFKMFSDHPIFGVGPVNYPYYFKQYEGGVRYKREFNRVPHSTPVQWMVETGIVGVIILLILQIRLFQNWYDYYKFKKINKSINDDEFTAIGILTQASAISQIVYWFCACFLSLIPYPFYWILIPFSEASRKLLREYKKQHFEILEKNALD